MCMLHIIVYTFKKNIFFYIYIKNFCGCKLFKIIKCLFISFSENSFDSKSIFNQFDFFMNNVFFYFVCVIFIRKISLAK